ncbi:MAG TPA: thiamine phosphate synthase [Hyphomicrobiaceae bacterium]|nr:thiamine phosphate synthase [Hyphomicrobiaceae bacterium]
MLSGDELACGLYLVVEAGPAAPERLAAALAVVPVACVLIEPAEEAEVASAARPLVGLAQECGAAALVNRNVHLARALAADGVHLPWSKQLLKEFEEARRVLDKRSIVGVHAGKSRHDAMLLAERGADYIGFGLPAAVRDRMSGAARRLELVAWWGEIFTVPCVAFDADTPGEAQALAAAGADFVACRLSAGIGPPAAADHVAAVYHAACTARRLS